MGLNWEFMNVIHAHSHPGTLRKSYGLRSLIGLNWEFMNVIHAHSQWDHHTVFDLVCPNSELQEYSDFSHGRNGCSSSQANTDHATIHISHQPAYHQSRRYARSTFQCIRQTVIASSANSMWLMGVATLRWVGIHRPLYNFSFTRN